MPDGLATSSALGPWGSAGLALLSLGLLLADVWWRRQHRLRVWLTSPERLLETPTGAGWLSLGAVPISLYATGAAVGHAEHAITPITAWLVALVLSGAGHINGVVALGAAGLLVAGLGVAAVPSIWCGVGREAPFIGMPLAGLWMLWLARFWQQQLHERRSWTTTGRLIPAARMIAVLFACGILVSALAHSFGIRSPAAGSTAATVVAVLLGLAFGAAAWRRAILDDSPLCATAGALAVTGVILAPWQSDNDTRVLLIALLAAAAVAAQRPGVGEGVRAVLQSLVFLWLPCVAVLLFIAGPNSGVGVLGLALIGVSAVVAAASAGARNDLERQ